LYWIVHIILCDQAIAIKVELFNFKLIIE
jgi:hypothetical protein